VPSAIGVDLGGTKLLIARVVDGVVDEVAKQDTPSSGGPAAILDAIRLGVDRLRTPDVVAVGVGAPGPGWPGGLVGPAPNLDGWDRRVEVEAPLREALRLPVSVLNDVNAAAVGEHRLGAGAGVDDLLVVWVGTGVGGGLVLDGALRTGRGLAGELGHMVIEAGGRLCGCGGRGHLEAYAGRAAMEREARRRHEAGRATKLVELAGAKRMKSSVFAKALATGDEVAGELLGEAVEALGVAIASAAALVDVQRVVVGGGLADRLGPQLVERIERATAAQLFAGLELEVVPARLGDDAGALGAALVALDAAGAH
jgi:glucokinase